MKKTVLEKLTLAFGALSLLFGFASCAADAGGGSDGGSAASSLTISSASITVGEATANGVNPDTDIIVAASSKPSIVTVHKVENDVENPSLVDTIKASDETLYSGNGSGVGEINVKDQLVTKVGGSVIVKPHFGSDGFSKLEYNTVYTVKFDGEDVAQFKTREVAPSISGKTISVGSSSSDDFATVQGALNYLMKNSMSGDWTINVAEGSYHERLYYKGSANVTLAGPEDSGDNAFGDKAIIYWKNNDSWNSGARLRTNFLWEGGNLTIKNLTLKSTYLRTVDGSSSNDSTEVLYFDSTSNLVAYDSSFLGHQDTLIMGNKGGRAWFYKDFIEGDVDFIWGYIDVALFEECTLHITYDDKASNGYIFASRTVYNNKVNKGYVLLNSKVYIDSGIKPYYGRNSGDDSQAAVINCKFELSPNSALWGSAGKYNRFDEAGDAAIAYKDFGNTLFSGSSISTSGRKDDTYTMSERVVNREYNGRYAILNRGFDVDSNAYKTVSKIWDISAYEEEFNATEDTSKSNVYVEPVYKKNLVGGNTVQLTASSDESGLTYSYESSDSNIASVTAGGLVTAEVGKKGTATITVTGSNGNSDTFTVTVIPEVIEAKAVNVSVPSATMAKYTMQDLNVSFTPAEPTVQTVKLTSSDENLKFFDSDSKTFSSELTVDMETTSVQIWAAAELSDVTITATSTEYSGASAGTCTLSTTENVTSYTAAEAWARGGNGNGTINFQGANGMWEDIAVDGTTLSTSDKKSKFQVTANDRIQARQTILYIPVTGASTVKIDLAGTVSGDFYFGIGDSTSNSFTASSDGLTYTYDYAGGSNGLVVGNDLSLAMGTKGTGGNVAANTKYLKVVLGGTKDRYISAITVTKTGEFTASFEEVTTETVMWDWGSDNVTLYDSSSTSVTVLQSGATGTAKGSSDSVFITVAGTGKLTTKASNGYGQFSTGTVLRVPVSEGSVVTVVNYDTKYKIAGEAASNKTSSYTASKAGYVVVESTGDSWITSITVTKLDANDDFSNDAVDFVAETKTVSNDESTLGLIATSASSNNASVATASVTASGIEITSVGAGSATITTSDGTNEATIEVTVGDYGAITGLSVTPYTSTLPETIVLKYNWESESDGGTRVTAGTNCVYGVAYSDEACTKKVSADSDYLKAVTTGSFNNDKNSYVQPSAGATMQIPVSKGSVVTISFWDSGAAEKFSLAGNAVAASDLTLGLSGKTGNGMSYTASATGYIELVCTTSYYIRYITVTGVATADVENHDTNATASGSNTSDEGGANDGDEVTADSWTLSSRTDSPFSGWDTSAYYTLTEDASVAGKDNVLALTIAAAGTGVGTTKTGTTANNYKYDSSKGLMIKKDALKISGITGDVKLTISGQNSGGSDRNLEVTVGATGTVDEYAVSQKSSFEYTATISASNSTIYIGASNELFIKSITIASSTTTVPSTVTWDCQSGFTNYERTYNAVTYIAQDGTKSTSVPSDLYTNLYADGTGPDYIDPGLTLYGSAKVYVPVQTTSTVTISLKSNDSTKYKFTIGGSDYTDATSVTVDCSSATLVKKNDISYLMIELGNVDGTSATSSTSTKGYIYSITVNN